MELRLQGGSGQRRFLPRGAELRLQGGSLLPCGVKLQLQGGDKPRLLLDLMVRLIQCDLELPCALLRQHSVPRALHALVDHRAGLLQSRAHLLHPCRLPRPPSLQGGHRGGVQALELLGFPARLLQRCRDVLALALCLLSLPLCRLQPLLQPRVLPLLLLEAELGGLQKPPHLVAAPLLLCQLSLGLLQRPLHALRLCRLAARLLQQRARHPALPRLIGKLEPRCVQLGLQALRAHARLLGIPAEVRGLICMRALHGDKHR
mmetsp:Transcript_56885/g.179993  ORF Transcript_56885/g.179993 Transcript_56885/m.179993 type:complete len:261 (-) Transcript_56885:310-1092(-)